MRVLRIAALWALVGCLVGVVLWSVIGGTLWQLYFAERSVGALSAGIPLAILGSAFWASFVGVFAFPCAVLVFSIWQLLARRWPALEATPQRWLLSALVLGGLPALAIIYSFGSGPTFDWPFALRIAPVALLSCWGAVWLPRRLIRALRRPLIAPAV